MDLYIAEPKTSPKGGIVVIQEAFGVTSHIEDVCDWLADNGWYAVAPTLFHRLETQVFEYDDLAPVMPAMKSLNQADIDVDLDEAFGHLSSKGFATAKCGIVGFCMGGSAALYVAATRTIGAAVGFYGGGLGESRFGFPPGVELAGRLQSPWLGLYGDLDPMIPVDQVEAARAAADACAVPSEVVRYENGQHGFNCDDRPAVFDVDIAADARRRTLAWFDQYCV
jgi:carboxymethylenebutenolidase